MDWLLSSCGQTGADIAFSVPPRSEGIEVRVPGAAISHDWPPGLTCSPKHRPDWLQI